MYAGFYKEEDIGEAGYESDDVLDKKDDLEGISRTSGQDVHTLLECHVELNLQGFEDKDQNGEETEIKIPYVVTVHDDSGKVLAIRRNYAQQDPMKKKKEY